MTIADFATKHAVRLKNRTQLRIPSVPGRYGFIRDCLPASRLFKVTIMSEYPSVRRFKAIYHACKLAGMEVHGRGDYEGYFLFDPRNDNQATVALAVIKARKKRTPPSAAQVDAFRRRMQSHNAVS